MSDEHHTRHHKPDWVPRHGLRIRWDRTLVRGDAVLRWHSRLDGTAVLHGPAGALRVGDSVAMPQGHLHRPHEAPPPPTLYVVTHVYGDEYGHEWVRVAREGAASPRT